MERNPYAPPESKVDGREESAEVEARPPLGGCLVALLVVMIVGNAWMSVVYALAALGKFDLPGLAPWIVPVLLGFGLVNLASLAAIFNWLRWGVYAAMTSAVLIFVLNVSLGTSVMFAMFGLVGPGLLLLLVRPLWKHFR